MHKLITHHNIKQHTPPYTHLIGNVIAGQALGGVHLNLAIEDNLVEERLQPFVAVVNAQLLEAVHTEHLEPEYVQNPNVHPRLAPVKGGIHAQHDVVENLAVDVFGEGVALVDGLVRGKRDHDGFAVHGGVARAHGALEAVGVRACAMRRRIEWVVRSVIIPHR